MTDTQVFLGLKIAGKKRPEHPSVRMAELLKCGAGKKIGSLFLLEKASEVPGLFYCIKFSLTILSLFVKMGKRN